MPSLKHIRKRISSVRNTQKVTKAMKLVAAAKLRRSQHAAHAGRIYTDALLEITRRARAGQTCDDLPLLMQRRNGGKTDLLLLTSDRGLCGAFNENLLRQARFWVVDERTRGADITAVVVGRKGRDAIRRKGMSSAPILDITEPLPEGKVHAFAEQLRTFVEQRFREGKSERTVIAYNRFFSAGTQHVVFEELLPVGEGRGTARRAHTECEPIFEPTTSDVLEQLAAKALSGLIAQALLDSRASEFAARMRAMDNATRNASDMIGALTLQFNRARQAAITTDLMDIIGGAEALK
ncbi:MAG: ATP synthase F1 subunit gamma [Deltaproteobacteria bacterium]|nr:ATP synthase F1 subunit gamma [Deltaproteobacteria bacterium]